MLSLLVIGYWLEKEFNFAVKEGCEETLENIKEGELIMVLMNSHLELVTTNRLITNFRSRFKHALNVKLALRFSSPIRKTLRLMAELL
ncbi:hypothetical protein D8674_029370 [Pyrus ussuriensis x Pyrus communis]|uniref:Uncharacterized protein n=1 Tax=Pyrus ussuriensis x Pyrus communis TaxID=2448454 RepID=A0A5N5I1X0_9ROSA|nr:hypothetical protein D8674_029370 [Pyrus ussuriensis x Pyrus communis]